MIQVEKLVKRFGYKWVLKGVNFSVQPGEFVGLLGPNGAGKTTLLRILTTLSKPTAGKVEIAGIPIPQGAPAVRHLMGVLSHQPLLYRELTAEENLAFFGNLYQLEDLDNKIETVLQTVGLLSRRKDLVRTFSRGMQQRLAIGRSIIHDPNILLLDEPYTGLDQQASDVLDEILKGIAAEGRAVVMTSHDLVRANKLCSRFDILNGGKIVRSATASELKEIGLLEFYRQAIEEKDDIKKIA
jgi:heme exporter protein A